MAMLRKGGFHLLRPELEILTDAEIPNQVIGDFYATVVDRLLQTARKRGMKVLYNPSAVSGQVCWDESTPTETPPFKPPPGLEGFVPLAKGVPLFDLCKKIGPLKNYLGFGGFCGAPGFTTPSHRFQLPAGSK
eukprot:3129266-Amphidinium_carterae.1